jgi:hemerythrin
MQDEIKKIDLNTAFLIGVDVVDKQHRFLIDLYNDLVDKLQGAGGRPEIDEVLKMLFDYTQYHFSAEEELMQAAQYPRYEAHRRQHETFIRALTDLGSCDHLSQESLAGLARFLGQWIQGHILITDKEMGEHIGQPH